MSGLEVARLVITKTISEAGDDVIVEVTWEPDDLAIVDALGMITFAQHSIVGANFTEDPT